MLGVLAGSMIGAKLLVKAKVKALRYCLRQSSSYWELK